MIFDLRRLVPGALVACAHIVALGSAAHAYDGQLPRAVPGLQDALEDIRGMSVTERPRPHYDPLGIRVGSFLLYPSIEAGGVYDDNIFATDGGEEPDFIYEITPSVSLISNWSNHAVNLFGTGTIRRFQDNASEDTEDYLVGGNGRLDITREDRLYAGAQLEHLHEDRGSPDDANGNTPTEYDLVSGFAEYEHAFNSTRVVPRVETRFYDFDDVGSTMGLINNDDRDRMETEGSLRIDQQVGPNLSVFVRGTGNVREYENVPDDNGFDRDSSGYEVVAGLAIDVTGLIFGDIFFGYQEQFYEDPAFSDTSGYAMGMDVTWNVTPLTTITGLAERRVEETTIAGSSGFFATRVGLAADHELLRNLIIHVGAAGQWNDYDGIAREDDIVEAEVQVDYLLNRFLSVELGYEFEMRESNVANQDYTKNVVYGTIRGQY